MSVAFAVIPAAGKSERMGRPKLSLPLGDRSVLEHTIAALRRADVATILVVLGPHGSELAPLARAAGAQVLSLSEQTPDMRATVERGLEWLEENCQPRAEDIWLMLPADHPLVDSAVVRQLVEARTTQPLHSIFVPACRGRRGHPLLIGWQHVAGIRALAPHLGLNFYLRQQHVVEVAVTSETILLDLDTPEDYLRLQQLI